MLRMTGCSCSLTGPAEASGTMEIHPNQTIEMWNSITDTSSWPTPGPSPATSPRHSGDTKIFIQKKDEDVKTSPWRISQMSVNFNFSLPVMIPSSFQQKRRNAPPAAYERRSAWGGGRTKVPSLCIIPHSVTEEDAETIQPTDTTASYNALLYLCQINAGRQTPCHRDKRFSAGEWGEKREKRGSAVSCWGMRKVGGWTGVTRGL